jgi:integrase/recombinase XerD
MKLNLYRRHRLGCEARRPEDARSSEHEERRKGWGRKCHCQIHISGTLDGKFSRKVTRTSDWIEAQRIAEAYQKEGSWTGRPKPEPIASEPEPAGAKPSLTIAGAIQVYLSNREAANLAPASLRKYGVFTRKLQAFAEERGYVMLDQFTRADIDVFYSRGSLGIRSKGKMLETLRTFFRFCVNRELVAKSPVSPDLKPPLGANRIANKLPFTDRQLADIIKACDQVNAYKNGGRWGNRFGSGEWTGEDLKDFVWLMTHTGLRISDLVLFDMNRLLGNEVFLRAKKNGGEVFVWIPDWLRDRLRERAKQFGRQPFKTSTSQRLDGMTDTWRQRLAKVFELADIGTERATPHRFRHTFARILLQRGVAVADVADLLGDDEKTVRAHYARWVPERQARLTKILKAAFRGQPKPTLRAQRVGRS